MRVTQIVNEIYSHDFTEWQLEMIGQGFDPDEISKASADLGNELHAAMEFSHKQPKTDRVIKTLENIRKFLIEHQFEVIKAEPHMFCFKNNVYQFDGHIDVIGINKKDNTNWIIDLKSFGLYDDHNPKYEFVPMSSSKKASVNLQTYLYKLTNFEETFPATPWDFSDYRRGCLHANHLGWEFIEFKRNPTKDVLEKVNFIIQQTTW